MRNAGWRLVLGGVLIAGVLLAIPATASAEFVYADSTGGITLDPNITVTNAGNAAGGVAEIDNKVMTVSYAGGPSQRSATVEFRFTNPVLGSSNLITRVYTDAVSAGSSITATILQYKPSGGATVFPSSVTPVSFTPNASGNDTIYPIFWSPQAGDDNYVSVWVKFTISAAGGSVQVEAVANPEPATFLLFGAGLLGVGAFARVRSRRRARRS